MKCFLKIIKYAVFAVALFFSFIFVNEIYSPKADNGTYAIKQFYKQKQDIDVICIGTSNVYNGIDSGILWNKYGIASYNLASGNQNIESSYLMVKEAIRLKKPKLIVIDTLFLILDEYRNDIESITYHATMGMKQNINRIKSIYHSYLPENKKMDYYLKVPVYKNRSDLAKADFCEGEGYINWEHTKGYLTNYAVKNMSNYELKSFKTDETMPLKNKTDAYLKEIFKLCKENDVKLFFIKTPIICYAVNDDSKYFYKVMNMLEKNAYENGAFAKNYNSYIDDIGIKYSTDFADELHLNYKGAEKFTNYFADDIKSMFDIPDRRGQDLYETYDIIAENYERTHYDYRTRQANDLKEFVNYIKSDKNMFIGININGDFSNVKNLDALNSILAPLNIKVDKKEYNNCFLYSDHNKGFQEINGQEYYKEFYPLDYVYVKTINNAENIPVDLEVYYNEYKLDNAKNGISFFIYDYIVQIMVENSIYEIDENENLVLTEDKEFFNYEF